MLATKIMSCCTSSNWKSEKKIHTCIHVHTHSDVIASEAMTILFITIVIDVIEFICSHIYMFTFEFSAHLYFIRVSHFNENEISQRNATFY